MSSTSEKGHAKNVANFGIIINFASGYGPLYNPSNPALAIPELEIKWEKAKEKLKRVKDTKAANPSMSDEDVDAMLFDFGVIKYLCLKIRFVKPEVLVLFCLNNQE